MIFKIENIVFSKKQKHVLNWWENSDKNGIICDGSVRSGKTLSMSISFIRWACANFVNRQFAICGKSIAAVRRNVIYPILPFLKNLGIKYKENKTGNYIEIIFFGNKNIFYLFGGYDSSSASLIQGLTLGGVLFDEVALMPESFVLQAIARCSLKNSKFWFNCNPENPYHWFYLNWIKKADKKGIIYIHFTMDDNPGLSSDMKKRYERLYTGGFFDRFIKGKWVTTHGLVYPNFNDKNIYKKNSIDGFNKYYVSCDYGTINPCSFGLWGEKNEVFYRIKEYYYDGRKYPKTDIEHFNNLEKLIDNRKIEAIVVDPSAASFIQVIKNAGKYNVIKADNNVENGIRLVSNAIELETIKLSSNCTDSIREFSMYRWKENSKTPEVVKDNDHTMDDIRYFVATIINKKEEIKAEDSFFCFSILREEDAYFR